MPSSNHDAGLKRSLIKLAARFGLWVKFKPITVRRTAEVRPRLGKALELLAPALSEVIRVDHEIADLEIHRRFEGLENVHKWHHYFQIYTDCFEPYRARPIRMLEIGVFRGGSLPLWKEWFHPESVIVGLDIDPSCAQHEKAEQGIHVRIGDQTDAAFLAKIVEEFGPFDVILDDGGHTTNQMITSFNCLFRDGLVDGGLYMVEDTHTNWWPGFVDSSMTFIEFAKALAELLHAPYFDSQSIDRYEFSGDGSKHSMDMRWIEAWLHSVAFYDSIVCFEKKRRTIPVHELR